MDDFVTRVLIEAQELSEKLNKLNLFMGSAKFPQLTRVEKDLLYEQQRAMSTYVQILGKRLEFYGIQFQHKEEK
jgi:hypothetical protein